MSFIRKVSLTTALTASLLAQNPPQRPKTIVETTRARLTVEVISPSFKAGSPILLKIQLKNVSSQPIRLTNFGSVFNYRVRILDAKGTDGPRTAFGRGQRKFIEHDQTFDEEIPSDVPGERIFVGAAMPISAQSLTLAPGEVWANTLDLKELYTLPPGIYQGQLSYTIPDWVQHDPKDTLVILQDERAIANGFTITVIP